MAKNIEVKILGDARPLQNSLNGASRNVREFEGHLGRAGRGALSASGAFSHLGRSIAFASGAFLGAAGFTQVVKQSVEAAISLEKEMAKTKAVFGSNTTAIDTWSKTTAHAFGISRAEALKSATQFGQLFKVMGVGSTAAVGMSKNLTELSAKLALFAGKSQEEAAAALAGGLTGRTRALKAYGIVIDQTTIKAEAMRLGLVQTAVSSRAVEEAQTKLAIAVAKAAQAHSKYAANTTQVASADLAVQKAHDAVAKAVGGVSVQLTAAQKAQAIYSLVQGQSTAASATWRKEQGSAEVQMRRLHAEIHDTEVTIGNALLPTVLKITTKMADWLGKTENQKKIQHDLNVVVKDAGIVFGILKDVIDKMAPLVRGLNTALGGTKHTFELLLGLGIAAKLRSIALSLQLVGTSAATAGGEAGVGGLLSKLGVLSRLGPIAVGIVVTYSVIDHISGFLNKLPGADFINKHLGGNWLDKQLGFSGSSSGPPTGPKVTGPKGGAQTGGSGHGHNEGGSASGAGDVGASVARSGVQLGTGSGIKYNWGGSSPQTGYDCSGYVYDMYRRNGINIPRTSSAQFNDPNAISVSSGELKPGDAVYFAAAGSPGPAPRHCGLYIGGGMFIQYFSQGKPAKTSSMGSRGDYMGARRWLKITSNNTTGDGSGTGGLTVGKSGAAPKSTWKGATEATIIAAKASVTAMLTAANTVIGGMAGPMDAIEQAAEQHLKKLREHLHPHMSASDLAVTKADIAKWGKVLNDEIAAQTTRAKRAFDLASKQMLRAFDAETAAGLKARAAPDETPTEALLRQRAEAQADAQRQQALADAMASGDAQAIANAQYDIETAALEKQAAAERKAADEKAAKDQADYQTQRDDQRQALQDQLDDWNTWLGKKMKTWNQFWAWVKANPNGGGVIPDLGSTSDAPGPGNRNTGVTGGYTQVKPPGNTGGYVLVGSSSGPSGGGGPLRMARGGIVRRPTMAIVGEAGPEAVVPLGSGVGGDSYTFHFPNYLGSKEEIVQTIRREMLRIQGRNGSLGFK